MAFVIGSALFSCYFIAITFYGLIIYFGGGMFSENTTKIAVMLSVPLPSAVIHLAKFSLNISSNGFANATSLF